jgi:hypothetical protein
VSAVLDCGTSYSILPDDWVQPIHNQFNVTYFNANDTAYVDCDLQSAPYIINYTFQSLTIQVPISVMVSLVAVNPNICTFGLVPAGTRHALLGDNFLSSSYAVFDLSNNQVSLASRNFASTTDNVVAVPAGGVKAIKSSTTNPSSTVTGTTTETGTGTTTGTGATTSATKKSGATNILFPAHIMIILPIGMFSLGSFF